MLLNADLPSTPMDLDEEISVLQILTVFARHLRFIAVCAAVAAAIALGYAVSRPTRYESIVRFATVNNQVAPSGLAALAGQLRNQSASSGAEVGSYSVDLYMALMRSPVLLARVARDSVTVSDSEEVRRSILEILQVEGEDAVARLDAAMALVSKYTTVQRQRNTGLVELIVASPSPRLSIDLIDAYLRAIESHNREVRKARVADERAFLERRMSEAQAELNEAEAQLQRFLARNREISPASPAAFQRDQLNRMIDLKQQIYKTLATNYEDVRIREVREAPYLTVVEPPRLARSPQPKKSLRYLLLGAVIGAIAGALAVLLREVARRMAEGRPDEASALRHALRDVMGRSKTAHR